MLKSAFKARETRSKSTTVEPEPVKCVNNEHHLDLNALFAPKHIDELCVAAKKVSEVRDWLNAHRHSRICLLSGPSGAGKTTAVRLIAKELQYDIKEWINPVDIATTNRLDDQYNNDMCAPQTSLFQSFLFHGSRYKSVFSACSKRLLLVEDFPNALLTEPANFFQLLEDYTNMGTAPLIFIASDSRSRNLDIHYKLFPDHIKEKLHIAHVEFNAISTTLLQKAMKRFCQLISQLPAENYKVPTKEVIDSIIISSQGDIRNVVINLRFASIVCDGKSLETMLVKAPTKTKKTQQRTLKSIGCDKSVTPFHALGRVFNPKWDEHNGFIHKPEEISNNFITEPRKLHNLVYANYIRHFSNIEDVVMAADVLSLTDMILTEYRESDMIVSGLDICIRGMMVSNTRPVSGWIPVCKAKHTDNFRKTQIVKLSDSNWISQDLYQTDCSTYAKIISNGKNKNVIS